MDRQVSPSRTIAPTLPTSAPISLFADLYNQVIGRPIAFAEMFWEFDIPRLAALTSDGDLAFGSPGARTRCDLFHHARVRFELPRWHWMRIAMGQALASVSAVASQ